MGGFQGLDLVQIDSNDHMFLLSVRILRSLNDRETDILVHTAAKVTLRQSHPHLQTLLSTYKRINTSVSLTL